MNTVRVCVKLYNNDEYVFVSTALVCKLLCMYTQSHGCVHLCCLGVNSRPYLLGAALLCMYVHVCVRAGMRQRE